MKRVDLVLRDLGLVESRARAQELIAQGWVTYQGQVVKKASQLVEPQGLELVQDLPYVGRGAYKLKAALAEFDLPVQGRRALDIGASTGGFTQVLLEAGASQVLAVDVGRDQLADQLRTHDRVVSMEETDFRKLRPIDTGQVDLAVIDVSFISVRKILFPLKDFLQPGADVLFLFKPQFESGGQRVKKAQDHKRILRDLVGFLGDQAYQIRGSMVSPIQGKAGNIEYLFYVRQVRGLVDNPLQDSLVAEAFKRFK